MAGDGRAGMGLGRGSGRSCDDWRREHHDEAAEGLWQEARVMGISGLGSRGFTMGEHPGMSRSWWNSCILRSTDRPHRPCPVPDILNSPSLRRSYMKTLPFRLPGIPATSPCVMLRAAKIPQSHPPHLPASSAHSKSVGATLRTSCLQHDHHFHHSSIRPPSPSRYPLHQATLPKMCP